MKVSTKFNIGLLSAIFLLSACAGAEKEASVSKEEVNLASNNVWECREISVPSLPELEPIEYTVEGTDITTLCASTEFDYDVNTLYDTLSEDDYVSSNYTLKKYREENVTNDLVNDVTTSSTKITDRVIATAKTPNENGLYKGFTVSIERDTCVYTDPNSIGFIFSNMKPSEQEFMYNIIKTCVGNDLAEYLIYGSDSSDNIEITDGKLFNEFHKEVKEGNTKYAFGRYITYNEDSDEELNYYSFYVYVVDPGFSSVAGTDSGYESSLNEMTSSTIEENFTSLNNFNINDCSKFASKYFSDVYGDSYVSTSLMSAEGAILSDIITEDPTVHDSSINFSVSAKLKDIVSTPTLNVQIFQNTVGENDFLSCTLIGMTRVYEDVNDESLIDELNKEIHSALPFITDVVTLENCEKGLGLKGHTEIFGEEHNYVLVLSMVESVQGGYRASWKFNIDTLRIR